MNSILSHYHYETNDVKASLLRFLNHGQLAETGRFSVLAADQGFEHGPGRSFLMNPDAFNPDYFIKLAIESEVNGFAAPMGLLESVSMEYTNTIPLILKMNSGNTLISSENPPHQAITASVDDAIRLGCMGIGFTLYFGSDLSLSMMEEFREIAAEARAKGLVVFAWSYPRGGEMSKEEETALDVVAYGAHMACLLGAHIIKVKIPTRHIAFEKKSYKSLENSTLEQRIQHIVSVCMDGRRLVGFSGGEYKDETMFINDIKDIRHGGGNGLFIGRNAFQRPFEDGVTLLKKANSIMEERELS
jgi:class I fructose-bisphosphate aldolase